MTSLDILRRRWRAERHALPCHSAVTMHEDGLVFGAGTVLARMTQDRLGRPCLAVEADRERLRALLFAVYGRPVPLSALKYIARASDKWREGDEVLAAIELAFARLPRLESREDAFRLFLAETLLEEEHTPRSLMRALGLDPDANAFRKDYNPDQPRVPAGSGRASGEWTSGGGTSAATGAVHEGRSSITAIEPAPLFAGSKFLRPALEALISGLSAAALYFRTLLIQTKGNSLEQGTLSDHPEIAYFYDPEQGRVAIERTNADGSRTVFYAETRPDDGIYDSQSRTRIGTRLSNGLALDYDVVASSFAREDASAKSDSDTPKLCPDPSPDKGGKKDFDRLYQEYVGTQVNPQREPPLSADLAFALPNPEGGDPVLFDHCRETNKVMIDAKGHYEDLLSSEFGKNVLTKDWVKQARRQIKAALASGSPGIEWHFYEESSMEFAREVFADAGGILDQIKLIHTPYPGTGRWPYPPSATWARGR